MSKEEVNKIARGRVYYGETSKKINLVDILGDMNDALEIAADRAKIEKYQIIEYPRQKSSIEKLVSSLNQVNFLYSEYLPKIDFLDSGRDLTSCCELIQVSEYKNE